MNLKGKIVSYLFVIMTVLLQSCTDTKNSNKNRELEGSISISGAFALYPLVVTWKDEFQRLHPKVKIDLTAGGAGKGMSEALSHKVNLGMISRGINQEEIQKGAWAISVAKDAVLPTINASNPYIKEILSKGLTKDEFYRLWVKGEITRWGELIDDISVKDNIHLFTRSDASGAAETWAKYLGGKQENLKGIGVYGDPGMAGAVSKDKLAVGFNNIAYVYDLKTQKPYPGLQVIPIDLNADGIIDSTENFYDSHPKIMDAIAHNIYPEPPARDLYFISDGPPKDTIIKAFFKWILTDGQKFVPVAGYIKLSESKVKMEVEILDSETY
jgi:phosphate transport system substrate-binding protein